jgi:quinol monooxygenase YgiN
MYGFIARMTAQANRRDELMKILAEGVTEMPGCLSYIVGADAVDPNLIWITEAWEIKQAHAASLSLPSVRNGIARGRPLIAAVSVVAEMSPVNGHGLSPAGLRAAL